MSKVVVFVCLQHRTDSSCLFKSFLQVLQTVQVPKFRVILLKNWVLLTWNCGVVCVCVCVCGGYNRIQIYASFFTVALVVYENVCLQHYVVCYEIISNIFSLFFECQVIWFGVFFERMLRFAGFHLSCVLVVCVLHCLSCHLSFLPLSLKHICY